MIACTHVYGLNFGFRGIAGLCLAVIVAVGHGGVGAVSESRAGSS